MRSTVVPAQVTTVEDRIAGSLTFPQLIVLVVALVIGAFLFLVIPPRHHVAVPKLIAIFAQMAGFSILALRVKGKIVADWLVLILRFRSRPRIYVFTKNDLTGREVITPEMKKEVKAKVPVKKAVSAAGRLSLPDEEKVRRLLTNPALSVSFALSKKGGIDVSLQSNE